MTALLMSAGRRLEECAWAVASEAAGCTVVTGRWHIHDELVRGDPIRVERPD